MRNRGLNFHVGIRLVQEDWIMRHWRDFSRVLGGLFGPTRTAMAPRTRRYLVGVVAGASMCCVWTAQPVLAGPILGPTSVVSSVAPHSASTVVENLINQTGLSAWYVSGVTDFDTFTSTTTLLQHRQ